IELSRLAQAQADKAAVLEVNALLESRCAQLEEALQQQQLEEHKNHLSRKSGKISHHRCRCLQHYFLTQFPPLKQKHSLLCNEDIQLTDFIDGYESPGSSLGSSSEEQHEFDMDRGIVLHVSQTGERNPQGKLNSLYFVNFAPIYFAAFWVF
ncbi:unnamed protein product, partial [Protopolystoma xenopodis]